eukprot:CAMPEP_0170065050 /NCGR_PEP_ID=MMETSP0019_2-20121128/5287_1 /TAXON_ID=98059 /ORGANISM="Dinobryon sp., Strain UTEXLB2267" /LENGTH=539 /DNA_ID=CAMNT_0010271831 /DNA_START=211 /DNA_END=1830 /DNA_ORIENTATION=+
MKYTIEEQLSISVPLQKLVFKGRVLKDDLTLDDYQIENGDYVFMVKGVVPTSRTSFTTSVKKPESRSNEIGNESLESNQSLNVSYSNSDSGNIAEMLQMQQHLIQNPALMQQIINTPMVESLLSDPDMIRHLMTNNPQMQALIKHNPMIGEALNDPAALLRSIKSFSNTTFTSENVNPSTDVPSGDGASTETASTLHSNENHAPQISTVEDSAQINKKDDTDEPINYIDIQIQADDRADFLLESLLQGNKQQSEILQEVVNYYPMLKNIMNCPILKDMCLKAIAKLQRTWGKKNKKSSSDCRILQSMLNFSCPFSGGESKKGSPTEDLCALLSKLSVSLACHSSNPPSSSAPSSSSSASATSSSYSTSSSSFTARTATKRQASPLQWDANKPPSSSAQQQLLAMGFCDPIANQQALDAAGGNINDAVPLLLEQQLLGVGLGMPLGEPHSNPQKLHQTSCSTFEPLHWMDFGAWFGVGSGKSSPIAVAVAVNDSKNTIRKDDDVSNSNTGVEVNDVESPGIAPQSTERAAEKSVKRFRTD